MNRSELYNQIQNLHLQEEIKSVYGKNYTQVSNIDLEKVVKGALEAMKGFDKKAAKKQPECDCVNKLIDIVSSTSFVYTEEDLPIIVGKLIGLLYKKHILLKSEIIDLMNN